MLTNTTVRLNNVHLGQLIHCVDKLASFSVTLRRISSEALKSSSKAFCHFCITFSGSEDGGICLKSNKRLYDLIM